MEEENVFDVTKPCMCPLEVMTSKKRHSFRSSHSFFSWLDLTLLCILLRRLRLYFSLILFHENDFFCIVNWEEVAGELFASFLLCLSSRTSFSVSYASCESWTFLLSDGSHFPQKNGKECKSQTEKKKKKRKSIASFSFILHYFLLSILSLNVQKWQQSLCFSVCPSWPFEMEKRDQEEGNEGQINFSLEAAGIPSLPSSYLLFLETQEVSAKTTFTAHTKFYLLSTTLLSLTLTSYWILLLSLILVVTTSFWGRWKRFLSQGLRNVCKPGFILLPLVVQFESNCLSVLTSVSLFLVSLTQASCCFICFSRNLLLFSHLWHRRRREVWRKVQGLFERMKESTKFQSSGKKSLRNDCWHDSQMLLEEEMERLTWKEWKGRKWFPLDSSDKQREYSSSLNRSPHPDTREKGA